MPFILRKLCIDMLWLMYDLCMIRILNMFELCVGRVGSICWININLYVEHALNK